MARVRRYLPALVLQDCEKNTVGYDMSLLPTSVVADLLPDAKVISIFGDVITIQTEAAGKQIFDAEAELRIRTGIPYELMCDRIGDKNKLRIKLADLRGIKV